MDEAEDVVERALVNGDAGPLGGGKNGHHLLERGFHGKDVQVRARDHNLADLKLAQLNGALDELLLAGGEESAFTNLADQDLQLFCRVNEGMRLRGANPHGANEELGGAVEQNNGPAKDPEEPTKRSSDEKGHALGALDAQALGHQLAEHDMKEGQQKKGGDHRGGVGNNHGFGARNPLQAAEEKLREGTLSDDAEGQAGDGDSDLNAGEDAVKIAQKFLDNRGASIALLDELLDAGNPNSNQSKLGSNEEGVEASEKEDAEKAEQKHGGWILAARGS